MTGQLGRATNFPYEQAKTKGPVPKADRGQNNEVRRQRAGEPLMNPAPYRTGIEQGLLY